MLLLYILLLLLLCCCCSVDKLCLILCHHIESSIPGSSVLYYLLVQFSHSVVSNSAIPWTAACQASLSTTNSQSLLKLMSIELVLSSSCLILCHPLLLLPSIFPSIRVFSDESVLCQSIGVSASASVLPMNIQD